MKLSTKYRLANRFNRPDAVVVIASFPGRTDRSVRQIDAVASYTDHFARSFRKELDKDGRKLVIFAQKMSGEETWYEERSMLVVRAWDKGSPLALLQIVAALQFFRNIGAVLVQFEFHQFGGNVTTALFPAFLGALRLLGKHVTLTLHQVVEDITTLSGHVNLTKGSQRALLFNAALRGFYLAVSRVAHTIVVHNAYLATRLSRMTGRADAIVIPHGLGAIKGRMSRRRARSLLGFGPKDRVILSFGFLTWYKGSDWLVKQVTRLKHSKVKLIMAGGESPNLADKPHYRAFITNLKETARDNPRVRITGFVEDRDIALYFAAADLVVLPYRALMSSSGPLAMTIAFEKPFIMANALKPYRKDDDFRRAMKTAGVDADTLIFTLNASSFHQSITRALTHKKALRRLSKMLKDSRLWHQVAERFAATIPTQDYAGRRTFAIMEGRYPSYAQT